MPNFLWGVATSSHQIEGNNKNNDWWLWEEMGKLENGVRSGRATDHWNRFREDIYLAKQLGVNSYRFSIEWSRVEPEERRWDDSAWEWYNDLIAECEKHKIAPMLTLHHFTSPLWFSKQDLFVNNSGPGKFLFFVDRVIEKLGPRIPLWCVINEPVVFAIGTYVGRFMPPAEFAPEKATRTLRNLLICQYRAYNKIHSVLANNRSGPFKHMSLMVGCAHNMIDFRPHRRYHLVDAALARMAHNFYNWSWLDAVTGKKQHFGLPIFFPRMRQVKEIKGKACVDFIGVNYYTKAYLRWRPDNDCEGQVEEWPIGVYFHRRRDRVSDLGWAVSAKGLKRLLSGVSSYGLPIIITENGIADADDSLREDYIREHISRIAECLDQGIDIRGYYHWSLIDNFEWIKGFKPRFGLYRVDYDDYSRHARPSVDTYRTIISKSNSRLPSAGN